MCNIEQQFAICKEQLHVKYTAIIPDSYFKFKVNSIFNIALRRIL